MLFRHDHESWFLKSVFSFSTWSLQSDSVLSPSFSSLILSLLLLSFCSLTKQKLDTSNCLSLCVSMRLHVSRCVSCCSLIHGVFWVCKRWSHLRCVCLANCLGLAALPLAFPSWTERKGQPHPVGEKRDWGEERQSERQENRWAKTIELFGFGCRRSQWLCLCVCEHQMFENRNEQHEYGCSSQGCKANKYIIRDTAVWVCF